MFHRISNHTANTMGDLVKKLEAELLQLRRKVGETSTSFSTVESLKALKPSKRKSK